MTLKGKRVLVCGADGFIGGHMVKHLLSSVVASVRAVDVKSKTEWEQVFPEAENLVLDLSEVRNCLPAVKANGLLFQLAADMGGMGFIESNKALCTEEFTSPETEPRCEFVTPLSAWSTSPTKRVFDVTLMLLFSPVLVPLLVLIAAAVRLSSPGPVIFRQSRIGRFGNPFTIFKFRTMFHSDCDQAAVVASAAPGQITNFGRFLRWLKLDELPQCINVLRGDMSLVGPRPKIAEQQIGTFNCRPGITGAATLAFAREESFLRQIPPHSVPHFYRENVLPLKQQLDSEYMARATLLSDLRLLLLTAARRWDTSILEAYGAPAMASAWASSAPAQPSLPPSS